MGKNKILKLREYYHEVSDKELIRLFLTDKNAYAQDFYAMIYKEASRRGLTEKVKEAHDLGKTIKVPRPPQSFKSVGTLILLLGIVQVVLGTIVMETASFEIVCSALVSGFIFVGLGVGVILRSEKCLMGAILFLIMNGLADLVFFLGQENAASILVMKMVFYGYMLMSLNRATVYYRTKYEEALARCDK